MLNIKFYGVLQLILNFLYMIISFYSILIRYIHSNIASIFFICIYIHIGRGIYYKSYYNSLLWVTGIILFLFLMLTSFLGYILPWGQMSYWGAVVITNLVSVIPFCGDAIVTWLWGGFSVSNPTLNRFFVLHYLFPFLLSGISFLHIIFSINFGGFEGYIYALILIVIASCESVIGFSLLVRFYKLKGSIKKINFMLKG